MGSYRLSSTDVFCSMELVVLSARSSAYVYLPQVWEIMGFVSKHPTAWYSFIIATYHCWHVLRRKHAMLF